MTIAGHQVAQQPLITAELPGTGGLLRVTPEDFEVEELPAYLPAGTGDHLLVFVEKRELTTRELVRELARAAGKPERELGYAGMKDRRALTRQWLSLPAAGVNVDGLAGERWRVLRAERHGNKLRTGHLRGNRFTLRLRQLDTDAATRARAIAEALRARGLPNYYGEQRFGRGGANLGLGLKLLAGERGGELERARRDRFTRRLLISSVQSALFNDVLAARIRTGDFDRAIEGDLMKKLETGGLFVSTDPAVDGERVRRFELSPTGPMFGHRMMRPAGEALAREEAVLRACGLEPASFERFGADAEGTRRPLRLPIELELAEEPGALVLRFELPKGSYATAVMREVMKDAPAPLADVEAD